MRGYDRHAWVALAEQAIYQLVDTQLAVPHVEIEARLFDGPWASPSGHPITFFGSGDDLVAVKLRAGFAFVATKSWPGHPFVV